MAAVGYTGSRELRAHHATVLYDADGRVAHVHHVFVLKGGEEPPEERRAELAHESARARGHDTSSLDVLHVDGSAIRADALHSVDVESRSLRYEDAPRPRRGPKP
jgi:hypothetical protein